MLTWIWGVVFLAAGVVTIARHAYVEEVFGELDDAEVAHQGRQRLPHAVMGLCFVMLSVIATWYSCFHPLFAWLSLALPEPDTTAHALTALH